jgi:tetratricopeptide (TPR) repeat protein
MRVAWLRLAVVSLSALCVTQDLVTAQSDACGQLGVDCNVRIGSSSGSSSSGNDDQEISREISERHDQSLDADRKGVAAYRAGQYEDAVWYFKQALKYEPGPNYTRYWITEHKYRDRVHKNLHDAEAALKVQHKAESEAAEQAALASKAALANKQAQQEQLAIAKKYSSLPAPPPPPPQRVPELTDRIKAALSEDAETLAALARKGSELPQPTKQEISDAIFRYAWEHGIPSDYARTYWTINKGASDDMNSVFDAVRKDLADLGQLGENTEEALERFEANLRSRLAVATKDAAGASLWRHF